jgi:hypothetical protein
MSKRKPRLPISDIDRKIIAAISAVTFLPGCGDKKFYKSIQNDTWLTEKQKAYLYKIFDRYRRQIRNYETLAMELEPERFKVDVTFTQTLFGTESQINITDLNTTKEKWTKRDRSSNE